MSRNEDRYARQTRFLGAGRTEKLAAARVGVVGCGALGGAAAATLARAGVGFLRVVDRDFLEPHNLQRQDLFDEHDLAEDLPKAEAAAHRLRRINSTIEVEAVVADLNAGNIAGFLGGLDLLLDGVDNFPARYLVNDFACKTGTPWIHGGCVGARGQVMTIVPRETPCLRCVLPEPPAAGSLETCETAGVLGPIVQAVAAFQACEAIKLLTGATGRLRGGLLFLDLWSNELRPLELEGLRAGGCPACGRYEFDWLEGGRDGAGVAKLCGRRSIQLTPASPTRLDWEKTAARLRLAGEVTANRFLLRFRAEGAQFTLFPDGRAIIADVDDVARAQSIYDRFVGR